MLFAFAAGFFNLFSLLLGEDDQAVLQGMGKQSLSILSEICDGWLTSSQLLFLFCRMLQLMREDREECDSIAIGYYASEKDVFGVVVKCKILEVVSGRLVKYGVYIYVVSRAFKTCYVQAYADTYISDYRYCTGLSLATFTP